MIYDIKHIYVPKEGTIFYLYKLWVKGFNEFYIGATENPMRRKTQHVWGIYRLLRPFKIKRPVTTGKLLPAHVYFAKKLCRRKITPAIKGCINFEVLSQSENWTEISQAEANMLKANLDNLLCLNENKDSSCYVHRHTKKRISVLVKTNENVTS